MATDDGRSRLQSFLLGWLMGGLAAFAASRLGARRPATLPGTGSHGDLRAFEAAPCFREASELRVEARERPR